VECAGLLFPGETIFFGAAIYASTTGHLSIAAVILAAIAGAILGNIVGFVIGRQIGAPVLARHGWRVGLTPRRLALGRYLFREHGGKVVFFGRFITVLRTYAAFFAGLNGMRRSRFLVANVAAAVLWAAACSFGAYVLGSAATQVGTALTIAGLAVAGALIIAGALVKGKIMRRLEERAEAAYPDPPRIDPAGERAAAH